MTPRWLSGRARVAGVIGWPVDHSLSPRLHGWWLSRYGVDGAYVPMPVRPLDLIAAIDALPRLGFAGVNVTLPHKEPVIPLLDGVTPIAERIGAVNTIVIDADQRRIGDNTDAFGFFENMQRQAPRWRGEAGPAMVLGAGGAARAVSVALLLAGVVKLRLCNRDTTRAHVLAHALGGPVEVVSWADRSAAMEGCGLVVNTTSLGMIGQPPLEVDLSALPPVAVVTDIVYRPLLTPLLKDARARGLTIVDGLGMLLHQARPGFHAWFGIDPEVNDELVHHVAAGMADG